MIETSSLVKWFGPTLAVDRVSFQIEPGQIVGFLGPNGAGKTTTLRILTGYLPPTSGQARVAGHDVLSDSEQARSHLGYMPESTPVYPEMRVTEYLHYRGRLMGMDRRRRRERIDSVCDRCGLSLVKRRVIGHLSKGNRQRVGLAQALLHEPPVLILDEPTAGLDPNQIHEVRKLIAELRGQHTVLLSTHILPEVERTADRVMIIAHGRIVADDSPDRLRRNVTAAGRVLVEVRAEQKTVHRVIAALDEVASVETQTADSGGSADDWCRAIVTPSDGTDPREAIGRVLAEKAMPLREMRYEAASLEQYFMQITDIGAGAHAPPSPV